MIITKLLDFLEANKGDSGVYIEADTVPLIAEELRQILKPYPQAELVSAYYNDGDNE